MTTDERITRLERAVGALGENLARISYLRPASDPGVRAAQEIHRELQETRDAIDSDRRREELEAELAGLGSV